MRDPQCLERSDLQEQVVPPGDVRRDGGREVHETREPCGQRRELRERISPANRAQRMNGDVEAQPPRGRVSMSRVEIAPVLEHEPDACGDGHAGSGAVAHVVEGCAGREPEQQHCAEVPLVHARAQHVDARPQPVSVNP